MHMQTEYRILISAKELLLIKQALDFTLCNKTDPDPENNKDMANLLNTLKDGE